MQERSASPPGSCLMSRTSSPVRSEAPAPESTECACLRLRILPVGVDREESAQPLQGGFVGDAFVPDEAGVEGAPAAVAFGTEMNGNGDDAVPFLEESCRLHGHDGREVRGLRSEGTARKYGIVTAVS